jgi:CBS domain containing-hemolysin-like protein
MKSEILIFGGIIFIWLLAAWEAFTSLSRGRIRRLESDNKDLARKLEHWKEDEDTYNIIFRILIFIVLGLLSGSVFWLLDETYTDLPAAQIVWVVTGIVFCWTIVAGIAVRMLRWKFDITLIRFTLPVIILLRYTVMLPFVVIIQLIARGVKGLTNSEENNEQATAEDEIMSLVEHGDEEGEKGALEEDEKRMIRGIFDLDVTLVREIMTPRVDMKSLPLTATVMEAKQEFIESGHSRIPVYGDSIDEIKGVIYAKDFLRNNDETEQIEHLAHKPVFIPETKNVGDLLEEFKNNSIHFAIVIDEYGGTAGIVSLEDILEEIVGEIRDEYDSEEDVEPEPVHMPDGSVVVDARTLIDDVNEMLEIDLPEGEDVDTIGGYVCGEFGKIPEAGEEITVDNSIKITVLKADKRKILTLKLKVLKEQND